MEQNWDVIIIGGGLAGYIAANYLSKMNMSILILEKGKDVGGRARTNIVKNHYHFNLGPHALYKKGEAFAILKELDIALNGKSPKLTGGQLLDKTIEFAAPFSPYEIFTTRFLKGIERFEWLRVLTKVMRTHPDKIVNQTFQQWVQSVTKSKNIESLLYILSRLATYSHAPEMTSAKVIVSHLKLALGGTLYVDGGWQTIINQLHNKANTSGVHIRKQTFVKLLSPAPNGHVKVILSNNEEITGKYVISTTSPGTLHEMLSENVELEQDHYFTQTVPIKGATLDVALSQLSNPLRLFAMGINHPLYYSVHSPYARLSESPNHAVLHVFKYLHPAHHVDSTRIKNELEQVLDKMQPGWKQYVVTSRFMPNLIVNQRLPQVGDELRLKSSKTGIPGLYIAGDWACPHFILADGAASSAKQAAQEIIFKEMGKISGNYQ